jgi:hypothetical protein
MLITASPSGLSNKLTKGNLHLLQKLYKREHFVDVVNTLGDLRVSTLFMDASRLVDGHEDGSQGTEDSFDFGNEESGSRHDISMVNYDEALEQDSQNTAQCTFGDEKLNRTILVDFTTQRDNHGLSKIFDPQNKSLLLETYNKSLAKNDTAIIESPTPSRMIMQREHDSASCLLKKKPFRTKSRIPKPKSFNIPSISGSRSKYDLRFPNLNT